MLLLLFTKVNDYHRNVFMREAGAVVTDEGATSPNTPFPATGH